MASLQKSLIIKIVYLSLAWWTFWFIGGFAASGLCGVGIWLRRWLTTSGQCGVGIWLRRWLTASRFCWLAGCFNWLATGHFKRCNRLRLNFYILLLYYVFLFLNSINPIKDLHEVSLEGIQVIILSFMTCTLQGLKTGLKGD